MFSRRSFDDEMVDDVRTRISSGYSHDAAVTHARVHWNLDRETAERLARHAELQDLASLPPTRVTMESPPNEGRSFSVPWGLAGFFGFVALSILAEVFADTPIGITLSTIVIIYVVWRYYRTLRWIGIKLGLLSDPDDFSDTSSFPDRPGSRVERIERSISSGEILRVIRSSKTILLATILVVAVIGVTVAFVVLPSADEPPATSVIWTEDRSTQVEPGLVRFEGRITNRDQEWSMENLIVITSFLNESGLLVSQKRTELIIDRVHPSQTRFYSYDVSVFESFDSYQSNFFYEWKK